MSLPRKLSRYSADFRPPATVTFGGWGALSAFSDLVHHRWYTCLRFFWQSPFWNRKDSCHADFNRQSGDGRCIFKVLDGVSKLRGFVICILFRRASHGHVWEFGQSHGLLCPEEFVGSHWYPGTYVVLHRLREPYYKSKIGKSYLLYLPQNRFPERPFWSQK